MEDYPLLSKELEERHAYARPEACQRCHQHPLALKPGWEAAGRRHLQKGFQCNLFSSLSLDFAWSGRCLRKGAIGVSGRGMQELERQDLELNWLLGWHLVDWPGQRLSCPTSCLLFCHLRPKALGGPSSFFPSQTFCPLAILLLEEPEMCIPGMRS